MRSSQKVRKEIITFIVIAFALSSIFYLLLISAGILPKAKFYVLGLMWCPGIAGLITRLLFHRNIRGFGWGWGKTGYQILGYLLPLSYASIAYVVVWLSGLGSINEDFSPNYLLLISLGTITNCLFALGEEIGWRGFLVPKLARLTDFTKTSLISGVIWSIWHYPLVIFANYNSGTPAWYGLTCFTLMAVGMSFALCWIRLKSGSVWTAMFFHASHNFYIQSVFNPLTKDTGITKFIIGEFGAALAVISVIFAYILWRMRSRLADTKLKSETEVLAES